MEPFMMKAFNEGSGGVDNHDEGIGDVAFGEQDTYHEGIDDDTLGDAGLDDVIFGE